MGLVEEHIPTLDISVLFASCHGCTDTRMTDARMHVACISLTLQRCMDSLCRGWTYSMRQGKDLVHFSKIVLFRLEEYLAIGFEIKL